MTGWAVAPPALVSTDNGEFYLAGFRNQSLVDEITSKLQATGAESIFEVFEGGLTRQAWRNLDLEHAAKALEAVVDPHGRAVPIVACPGITIASLGCSLDQLLAGASTVHLESKEDLQRFEPRTGRWKFTTSSSEVGAYRVNFAGRRYFVRDASGTCRASGHALAKIFAAREEGVALHGYDDRRRRFFGVLGCDVPGLYSRALASCSGRLATNSGRLYYYDGVPEFIAMKILNKLYGKI